MDSSTQIEIFQDFIDSKLKAELLESSRKEDSSLRIDFSDLSKYNVEICEELLLAPEDVIKAAELALEKFDVQKKLRVRFFNLPESTAMPIGYIRARHLSKFIRVTGVIRTKTPVRPQVVGAKFECPSCGNIINITQEDANFQKPSKCSCGRKGKFKLIDQTLIDAQKLTLEEAHEDLESGSQPKRLDVLLKEDLSSAWTDKRTNPGTKVIISGFVKEVPVITKAGSQSITFNLVLMANHLETAQEDFSELSLEKDEEDKIKELAKDPAVFEKLNESVAPSIYGHDKIKDALVLQMFGGVRKVRDDGVVTRGDTHILLIGDPGSGKSQLIKRMAVVAPKSRYVSGKGVSGAGLTASVVKDDFSGSWALEAGAIVLANKGFCFIDEMDKMNKEDRDAMHEALEQQSVSISKANIQATLRCETTVLAAANPKFGRFDPYLSISEQIDMPPSLISRFDLIFPVKDLPDKDKDEHMSLFILKLHQNKPENKKEPPVETDLLRKYVAFSRQNCKPVLTDEAIEAIQKYYVETRSLGGDANNKSVAISTRQLEGIVRMAEASARVRLSKEVSVEDTKRAIDLVQFCLMEIALDKETGKVDIDKISSGITSSERGKLMSIREIINDLENKIGRVIPIDDIIKEAELKGIAVDKVEEAIEKLKRSGDIFEPRAGFISKL